MNDLTTKKHFRSKVEEMSDGCWEWTGSKHPKGYGFFSATGKKIYAHRYIWQVLYGPIPTGFELDHLCNNKSCVRPDHLDCVTHSQNMARAAENGAWNGTKNGNAKRTESEVLAIKIFAGLGVPIRKLAEYLGIPVRSVYAIVRGECWAHLEPPPPF
jgi:hypothetical protein